ncbi:cold-shock protein [Mesorhizobium sp.]|uniref:cold-shock protein n=1 Tax=Mesorhizobium sp. TaxID=1871066 RepID=UPI001FE19F7D|nr:MULTISPECIES: cold shock domain-containing protein [unclassified Mesorhizobium]
MFVHATGLTRSGLSTLMEGQKVFVQCGQGKKGPEGRSIRSLDPCVGRRPKSRLRQRKSPLPGGGGSGLDFE